MSEEEDSTDSEEYSEEEVNIKKEKEEKQRNEEKMQQVASKTLRFFNHFKDPFFFLFVECGISQRTISAQASPNHEFIELNIKMPGPPDELIQSVHANKVLVTDYEGNFKISVPGYISKNPKDKKVRYFPSEETAFWVIYEFRILQQREEDQEEVMKVESDLATKFIDLTKKNS